jgi:hypothetical protein
MALVIHSGIKDEMPSFAKKYNVQDTAAGYHTACAEIRGLKFSGLFA